MQPTPSTPVTPAVTVVVRVRDDEERVGHACARIGGELRAQNLPFELVVADEASGDNSVAVATLLKRELPELTILHAPVGRGFYQAAQQARGRALLLVDARAEIALDRVLPSLAALKQQDVVVVVDSFVVLRRTKTWRTFAALVTTQRRPRAIERRLLRRAARLSKSDGWRATWHGGWQRCLALVARPLRLLSRPRRLALP